MFAAKKGQANRLDGSPLSIGIVQARFNEDITNALAAACIAELRALGVEEKNIQHVLVPGALEVPVARLGCHAAGAGLSNTDRQRYLDDRKRGPGDCPSGRKRPRRRARSH